MPVNFYEHSDIERVTEYPSGVKISPEQTLTFYSGLYLVSPAEHVQLCSLTAPLPRHLNASYVLLRG